MPLPCKFHKSRAAMLTCNLLLQAPDQYNAASVMYRIAHDEPTMHRATIMTCRMLEETALSSCSACCKLSCRHCLSEGHCRQQGMVTQCCGLGSVNGHTANAAMDSSDSCVCCVHGAAEHLKYARVAALRGVHLKLQVVYD